MAPFNTFTIGNWWMREASRQPVPPRIIKAIRRIMTYLKLYVRDDVLLLPSEN